MPDIGDVDGMKQAISDGRLARYKGPSASRYFSSNPVSCAPMDVASRDFLTGARLTH